MKNLIKLSCRLALLLLATQSAAQNFNMQLRSTVQYPGQTVANICGYWQDGREYALVGASGGMSIVDITNPDLPVKIGQYAGPESGPSERTLWREIKVYQHYAYFVTEAGGGVQIFDLSGLPNATVPHYSYTGDGVAAGQIDQIHALHIDVTKGFLYIYGGNSDLGTGANIFDLNQDPYNPRYVGGYHFMGYIHDGYVDNDTLYAAHINKGYMTVVNMANKSNPQLLGSVDTPGKFTHNTWITGDRKHILTTDETTPSFLASYDVSDPEDLRELDRLSPNDGNQTYVHNTHILNDYAVTSWYTDGVFIVDAHRPENLVFVGHYDTYAGSALEFEGCWGAFPFFPSGTVIASDIEPGELSVLTPTYQRACYLEGVITNGCNGQPLPNAHVEINGGDAPKKIGVSKTNGVYRTGQLTPGNFTATISAPGFTSETVNITLSTAQVTTLNVALGAGTFINPAGTVVDADSNTPIDNAIVLLNSSGQNYNLTTNANGQFNVQCAPIDEYTVVAGKWGYDIGSGLINSNDNELIKLVPHKYYDDCDMPLGWQVASTSSSGIWEWAAPNGTSIQNNLSNPEEDASTDDNPYCYVTGNSPDGAVGADDIDDGNSVLTTPPLHLAGYSDALFTFDYWFFNAGGNNSPNDNFKVNLKKGAQTFPLFTQTASSSTWRHSPVIHLGASTTLTDDMYIEFVATDIAPGHLVEAGVDLFKIEGITTGTGVALNESARCTASPNPSSASFSIDYQWDNLAGELRLEVRDILGRVVEDLVLPAEKGLIQLGDRWTPGVYMATLRSGQEMGRAVRLVKQ